MASFDACLRPEPVPIHPPTAGYHLHHVGHHLQKSPAGPLPLALVPVPWRGLRCPSNPTVPALRGPLSFSASSPRCHKPCPPILPGPAPTYVRSVASACIGTGRRLPVALLLSDQLVSGDEAQFIASFASPHGAEAVPSLPACWNILSAFKQNALEPP